MSAILSNTFPWQTLIDWYESYGRHHLPWRDYTHPERLYRVWLSEILLQQTQVDRVIPYLAKIVEKYPTIHHLASATYEEFFPYYQGMGYYSRARNILKTAKVISEEYGGIFPMDKKLLKKLPGVGEYTASAILGFGYGEPHLTWDTNLEKVFARYYNGRRDMKLTEEQKEIIEEEFRIFVKKIEEKIDDNSKMGVRGEGTVGTKMITIGTDEQSEEEGVGLPLETFGTFGHKSTENSVGKVSEKKQNVDSHIRRNDGNTGFLPTQEGQGQGEGQHMIVRAINNALMDFAATVDLKNPENIDWGNYPIRSGLFYETRGNLEPREEKKSIIFPIPDATVIVILHEDHKKYYSLDTNEYVPFSLNPSLTRDTRKYIQDYFRDTYALELSVRPVHQKWLTEDGKPYIAANAQIQAGHPAQFREYNKKEAQEVLQKMIPEKTISKSQ